MTLYPLDVQLVMSLFLSFCYWCVNIPQHKILVAVIPIPPHKLVSGVGTLSNGVPIIAANTAGKKILVLNIRCCTL